MNFFYVKSGGVVWMYILGLIVISWFWLFGFIYVIRIFLIVGGLFFKDYEYVVLFKNF